MLRATESVAINPLSRVGLADTPRSRGPKGIAPHVFPDH